MKFPGKTSKLFFFASLREQKGYKKWNVQIASLTTGKRPFFAWSVVPNWELNVPIVKKPYPPGQNFVTPAAWI
jgi:hypothetical protein